MKSSFYGERTYERFYASLWTGDSFFKRRRRVALLMSLTNTSDKKVGRWLKLIAPALTSPSH